MLAKCTVLVIDDERLIREVFGESLRDAGYDVANAENGTVALAVLETRLVDVILLDLMMPVMDGITVVLAYSTILGWRISP